MLFDVLDAALCPFRSWRAARGGIWVRWTLDQGGTLWLRYETVVLAYAGPQFNGDSTPAHLRRPEGAHGQPYVEDWR